MTYAEKVKKLREVMLISQGELAEILSLSQELPRQTSRRD